MVENPGDGIPDVFTKILSLEMQIKIPFLDFIAFLFLFYLFPLGSS